MTCLKKNSGLQYKNWKKQLFDAKSMRVPCSTKCRIQCTSKIGEQQRNVFSKIFGIWQTY